MDNVFLKTRELAQALMESDQYKRLEKAQERCSEDAAASKLVEELMEARSALRREMTSDAPDPMKMKRLSDEADAIQEQLELFDDVTELNLARDEFYNLIGQVNQVLQFIVTGNMEGPDESCTGNCAGCGGCH